MQFGRDVARYVSPSTSKIAANATIPAMMRGALLLLTAVLTAQSAPLVEITGEPHHHMIFANDQVRVFNVEVAAGSETLMHWHRHDYIYVMLGPTQLSNEVRGKPPIEMKLQDGQADFSPGPFSHLVRVRPGQPFRNVTIELLQDDKLRRSTAHWDEDRGLEILKSGTQEILFVKDGVRVSEFELHSGGAIPSRSRSGPLLLVAVTDLDLYTNDPRSHGPPEPDPTPPHHFSSGNSTWLPHGLRRPIVNAGHALAKFVTLEFP